MVAEIIPGTYDAVGRKTLKPDLRRGGIHPTFPMGRYVSHPLAVQCKTLEEVRQFLKTCRPVTDKELFGKLDYWQPPEEFEKLRKGDCDDFALWTWRQLLDMGYDARVVFGRSGRYGVGHAWVTFEDAGKTFLIEPMFRLRGTSFPRLLTLQYYPALSAKWDGTRISFYSHTSRNSGVGLKTCIVLIPEWLEFWACYWFILRPWWLMKKLWRKLNQT